MSCQPGAAAGVCLALAMSAHTELKGLMCADHPLYRPGLQGEIIRSWSYGRIAQDKMYFTSAGYMPRYNQHMWAPVDNPKSDKYRNLDFFSSFLAREGVDDYIHMHFQRPAKVYILVNARFAGEGKGRLPGWKPEGWVEMVEGSPSDMAKLGVSAEMGFHVWRYSFAFSAEPSRTVVLPGITWLRRRIQGLTRVGNYFALVGEADGSATRRPRQLRGMEVAAGGRCPEAMHDAWRTRGTDARDAQTRRSMFRTHHPLWDPCWWCAYSHEHGSSAKHLMGYEPRYGYVALKNRRESESHNGFKSMVLLNGPHLVYYGLHMHMSRARRFFARFHTAVFAVVDARSHELLLELSYKADYGFLSVRLARGGHLPLRKVDRILAARQDARTVNRGARIVNVIDPKKLDRRFMYRDKQSLLKGEYEQWITHPLCARRKGLRAAMVDIKDPVQALRRQNSNQNDTVTLGKELHGVFKPAVGVSRDFRVTNLVIAAKYCHFKGLNNGKIPKSGIFYTDTYGKRIIKGPSRHAVRQYIKPGFTMNMSGIFMPDDTWLGLHKNTVMGGMWDITYAIDPKEN